MAIQLGFVRRFDPGHAAVRRAIEASREATLERLLFALGIEHVGESTAKALAQWFGELELIRHLPWPLFKRVPDIGGEVARSLGHFFEQQGNQQAIDDLLQVGQVRITDEHPPSGKLRGGLDLAQLLVEAEIPGITRLRAEKLAAALSSAQSILDAEHGQFVNAGLPDDTARGLAGWLDSEGHGELLLHQLFFLRPGLAAEVMLVIDLIFRGLYRLT